MTEEVTVMSALADQVLTDLEQRAVHEDVFLDRVDKSTAAERFALGGSNRHHAEPVGGSEP